MIEAVAVVLWVVVTVYAVFGGADFGAGILDLVAGGADRGARPRAFMDRVLTPVWEANHVWLIYALVLTWTALPDAFAAIMSTLLVPLGLAALGIVLRGSGFAFRKVVVGVPGQRALGAAFALGSLMTPLFMGAVVGAIATGRVPTDGRGDRWGSWLTLPSLCVALLFAAACAHLASVLLVQEARVADDAAMVRYFRVRALAGGVLSGALAVLGLIALHADGRGLFDDLLGAGLPLVLASVVSGAAALVQLWRRGAFIRELAAGALVCVVWAWGVAQWPDALPGELTLHQAAAPRTALTWLLGISVAAALTVGPALALLFTLQHRDALEEDEAAGAPVGADR
ncbi:MAG: cytochrome ubiquinol oxidase subunit [Solirubrobacterales bacterium]|nr:cytochrome ubiquinol oxidase subunit [Solirubrobacterales bacterium]